MKQGHPKMRVDAADIREAQARLRGRVAQTPLREAVSLRKRDAAGDRRFFLKLENLQEVGSFKVRGAFNKLMSLTSEEREMGVAAVSSGNHGISVSYAAHQLGIQSTQIFVPETTPAVKIDKILAYGADVVRIGKTNNETEAYVRNLFQTDPRPLIDPCYRDYLVYAGQGTIGLEIMEQNPEIDTIVVPIGGGGLLTGISVAAKSINPKVRVIGVETEASPSMTAALRDQVYYEEFPIQPSLCEALVGGIGWIAYQMAGECIDEIIVVKESRIREAVRFLYQREHVAAEASSAICLGAVLQEGAHRFGTNTALIISGGNIDRSLLEEIVRTG